MQTQRSARILVVEDELDIRQLMYMHLLDEGYDIAVADDGEKALKHLTSREFDLLILDWMLPGLTGLDLCVRYAHTVPILMVTARADTKDIVAGLEAGADDYLTKPFEIPVFLARVRALLRRKSPSSKDSNERKVGEVRLNISEHKVWIRDEEIKLTLSEFKLLTAFMSNVGKVLSRDLLIGMVQGPEINVTDRTIDTHVFGLRKKLGFHAEMIETIRGVGYRVKEL